MRRSRRTVTALLRPVLWGVALWVLVPSTSAFARGGQKAIHILSAGLFFHKGAEGSSLGGANTYFMRWRAETKKGFFRTFTTFEYHQGSGSATLGSKKSGYTIQGGSFSTGFTLFLMQTGRFIPYFGGGGVFGWHGLDIPSPDGGIEKYTQSFSVGYQAHTGVDLRLGSKEGNTIRLQASFFSATSSQLGPGGVALNAIRVSIGIGFYR